MKLPCYINLKQARQVLSEMGVKLARLRMKRPVKGDICTNDFNESAKKRKRYVWEKHE